jgi:hypothetical protein
MTKEQLEKRVQELESKLVEVSRSVDTVAYVALGLCRIIWKMSGNQRKAQELGEQMKSWNEKLEKKVVSTQPEEVSNDEKGKR